MSSSKLSLNVSNSARMKGVSFCMQMKKGHLVGLEMTSFCEKLYLMRTIIWFKATQYGFLCDRYYKPYTVNNFVNHILLLKNGSDYYFCFECGKYLSREKMEVEISGWYGVCKLCSGSNRIEAASMVAA